MKDKKNFEHLIENYIKKTLNLNCNEILNLKNDPLLYKKQNEPELREKYFIFYTYYNFINEKSCIVFLEQAHGLLSSDENKKLIAQLPKDSLLTVLIIILKSFISKAPIFYGNQNYLNSDECLNYCVEQFKKYCVVHRIYIFENKLRKILLPIFSILVERGLIHQKKISIQAGHIKTIKHYYLHSVNYVKKIEEFFNFSFMEFTLIEYDENYFIHTLHYSRTYEICKKNFYSNKYFIPKNLPYLLKKINLKLYIDDEFVKENKKKFNKSFEDIENILKKKHALLNSYYDSMNWTSSTKTDISFIQKEISQLLEELIVNCFFNYEFNYDHFVIFPLFMDFRGRKYYDSIIGPTSSKYLRMAYYYGYYNLNDFENQFKLPIIWKNEKIIKNFFEKHSITVTNLNYQPIYWCVIGIGKHFIEKNKSQVDELEFINKGLEYFENFKLNDTLKLVDKIEIEHYVRIIKSLNNSNLSHVKKRTIAKDATASINQIFMKKLGPLNQESLNYVNLGKKVIWWDTYLIHREKFYEYLIKNNKQVPDIEKFNILLSRKLIKKFIMTIPYSAGFNLCWENYVKNIKENEYDIEIDSKLKCLIQEFYNFVKNEMQINYLYKKPSTILLKQIHEEFEEERMYIIESNTGEADISYYKMKRSSIDKKYKIDGKSKRVTKLVLEVSESIDLSSFKTASGANLAHFFDADEIREIEISLGHSIITIHDSYLIDFLDCSRLISIRAKHYTNDIKKTTNEKYKITNTFNLI